MLNILISIKLLEKACSLGLKFIKHFTGQGVLLDRSVFSDAVFAEVNYQQGTISHEGTNSVTVSQDPLEVNCSIAFQDYQIYYLLATLLYA